MLLEQHTQKAIWAHNWTSFSPEKRGETMIKEYSEELQADIDYLMKYEVPSDAIEDYKKRYERLFLSWLSAKSRCASAMITGPANFPVRRNEKANRSERRHYEVFAEWRERAKKAIIRKALPPKTLNSEIDRYRAELEGMKANHELMKEANKRIKAAHKSGEDLTEYLTTTFGVKPHMIEHMMKWGFGLTNNNANMKRVEQRIKELSYKETKVATTGNIEHPFEGGKIVVNYEADRLQIKHDTKPAYEVIQKLKQNGFKWSPSNSAWQRVININGIYAVRSCTGIEIKA